MDIYERASGFFSGFVKKNKKLFASIEPKLKIAKISAPIEAYGSVVILVGLLTFIISLIFFSIIGLISVGFSLIGLILNLMVSLFIGVLASGFVYMYPTFVINERRDKLDNSLAFISLYMSTLSKSGFSPQNIFGMLSKFKDYPAAASEASKIDHEVNKLGMALPRALDRAIKRSPSPAWTEFLAGIKNSIVVGGDLNKYLEEKAKGFVQEYKRKLEKFSKTLTLLMHMYITVIIVGTIFFVVISSLMGAVGGVSIATIKVFHYIVVFGGLPMITAVLITIIKNSSPWAE